MRIRNFAPLAAALLISTVTAGAGAQAVSPPSAIPAESCELHLFPAPRLRSVGEDFDQVHRLDQDIRHFEKLAGRPLDLLGPARQLELSEKVDLASVLGLATTIRHDTPLKRSEAVTPVSHVTPAPACHVEVMVPQMLIEDGGLSAQSFRLFGVVRRFAAGQPAASYSGFATAELPGFKIKGPTDIKAATENLERAFREALLALAFQARARVKKN